MVTPTDEACEKLFDKFYSDLVRDYFASNPYASTDSAHREITNKSQADFSRIGKPNLARGPSTLAKNDRFDGRIEQLRSSQWDSLWSSSGLTGKPDWANLNPVQARGVVEGKLRGAMYFTE